MKTRILIITLAIVAITLVSLAMPNLSKVYGSCEMTKNGTLQFAIGYQYTNGLLYIDNNECTWKLFGYIPITSLLSEEISFHNFSITQFVYAEKSHTFEIEGYPITTNTPDISTIEMDWNSQHLSMFSVTFTEPYTGQFQIQIPKNMPRMMNLDFETPLMMDISYLTGEEQAKDWDEHITEKDFKMIDDRVSETESLCPYVVTVELTESDYFKIVTGSVASGRWETVTIENEECDSLYDELTIKSKPISETEPEVTGSYEIIDENGKKLCLGGPHMILNDQCQRIGNYDIETGIPIVNNKGECDKLDGTWYDDRKLCDSKYAPVEYRFQFGPEPEPESYYDPNNPCLPGKVFDWDICVDECPFGTINNDGICQGFEHVGLSLRVGMFGLILIFIAVGVSVTFGFILWWYRK